MSFPQVGTPDYRIRLRDEIAMAALPYCLEQWPSWADATEMAYRIADHALFIRLKEKA